MSQFAYSILAIDGGGIRGIIPCMILEEIERQTGKPIAHCFDLIAGTSTGGMLAGGLTIVDDKNPPPPPVDEFAPPAPPKLKFAAKDLLSLYKGRKAQRIFQQRSFRIPSLPPLFRSRSSHENIEQILSAEFEAARLKDSATDILITSYDTINKKPFYFRSRKAQEDPNNDYKISDICRATSAAPTYFPPKALTYNGADSTSKHLSLIDGGVFANNPSMLAYVEAMEIWKQDPVYKAQFAAKTSALFEASKEMGADPNPDDFAPPILFVSLGTGQTKKSYPHTLNGWGALKAESIIDILMQGVSESVHYQMQYIMPPYLDKNQKSHPRYYRLNIDIDAAYAKMDDTSDATIAGLETYGRQVIKDNAAALKEICDFLKDSIAQQRTHRREQKALMAKFQKDQASNNSPVT